MPVRVFVWFKNEGNVGHSSMRVGSNTYISYWPEDTVGKRSAKTNRFHRAQYVESYSEDCLREGNRRATSVKVKNPPP